MAVCRDRAFRVWGFYRVHGLFRPDTGGFGLTGRHAVRWVTDSHNGPNAHGFLAYVESAATQLLWLRDDGTLQCGFQDAHGESLPLVDGWAVHADPYWAHWIGFLDTGCHIRSKPAVQVVKHAGKHAWKHADDEHSSTVNFCLGINSGHWQMHGSTRKPRLPDKMAALDHLALSEGGTVTVTEIDLSPNGTHILQCWVGRSGGEDVVWVTAEDPTDATLDLAYGYFPGSSQTVKVQTPQQPLGNDSVAAGVIDKSLWLASRFETPPGQLATRPMQDPKHRRVLLRMTAQSGVAALTTLPPGDFLEDRATRRTPGGLVEWQGNHVLLIDVDRLVTHSPFSGFDDRTITQMRALILDDKGLVVAMVKRKKANQQFLPYLAVFDRSANQGWVAAVGPEEDEHELQDVDPWLNQTCAQSGPCWSKSLDDCRDTNPCTSDLCDAEHGGCYHVALPDGVSCSDAQVCVAGKCGG